MILNLDFVDTAPALPENIVLYVYCICLQHIHCPYKVPVPCPASLHWTGGQEQACSTNHGPGRQTFSQRKSHEKSSRKPGGIGCLPIQFARSLDDCSRFSADDVSTMDAYFDAIWSVWTTNVFSLEGLHSSSCSSCCHWSQLIKSFGLEVWRRGSQHIDSHCTTVHQVWLSISSNFALLGWLASSMTRLVMMMLSENCHKACWANALSLQTPWTQLRGCSLVVHRCMVRS